MKIIEVENCFSAITENKRCPYLAILLNDKIACIYADVVGTVMDDLFKTCPLKGKPKENT